MLLHVRSAQQIQYLLIIQKWTQLLDTRHNKTVTGTFGNIMYEFQYQYCIGKSSDNVDNKKYFCVKIIVLPCYKK